jgi:4,5-DOPA dioxygenase extradiol
VPDRVPAWRLPLIPRDLSGSMAGAALPEPGRPDLTAKGLVYALFAPNAPNLIEPSVFGGAGAATVRELEQLDLAGRVDPDVVLVCSPHFQAGDHWAVQGSAHPPCVHDFSGFPPSLFRVRYEPPGAPELARRLVEAGRSQGLPIELTEAWGLDHGAWAPLMHLLPKADRPVVPISISHQPPAQHVRWGQVIAKVCREAGVRAALLGTGSIAHRLDQYQLRPEHPWPEGAALEAAVVKLALERDVQGLMRFNPASWAKLEPEGELSPLFVLLGALGPEVRGRLVATGQLGGAVGLSILEYWNIPGAPS